MTDPATITKSRQARVERGERLMGRFASYMLVLTFGVPILIVLLYHFVSWKAAVFVFPLLLVAVRLSVTRKNKVAQAGWSLHRLIHWMTMCIIPIVAITTSDKEFMRLWALAAGFLLTSAVHVAEFNARRNAKEKDVSDKKKRTADLALSAAPGL
ncbi:MAG: hypothetical protein ACRCU5_13345, partial [Rhizobiaceae bacterium]